jgi:HlyD family secretion protein
VPEALFAGTTVGMRLDVRCNGCPQGLAATVSYVSQEPEFTPPVIYSADTRQKLVYLVEARPEGAPAARLQPGQIVDVMLRGRR